MSRSFVRTSKFRHVFGTSTKRDQCYENIKLSNTAWDSDLVCVNTKYIAVLWNAGGGGAFAALPLGVTGRLPENYPTFNGHTGQVLDISFHPFNEQIIASASEDTKIMIWSIPQEGLEESLSTPVLTLSGHGRKVGQLLFHPTAENIIVSGSADLTAKVWDVEKGTEVTSVEGFSEIPQSLAWDYEGKLVAGTCRDKILRIMDPRQKSVVAETQSHSGVKGSRVVFLGDTSFIGTTGFSKLSDRQLYLWDTKNLKEPIHKQNLDTSSGVLMPHYDGDTKMLYLAGKGDGNIRYYELEDNKFHFLNEYKSTEPQRGIGFMPKRALNCSENEVARAYKVHSNLIEPIPFTVPRKAESFQADIYPDTIGDTPSITADEWVSGKNGRPKLISLEEGFVPSQQKEFTTSAPQAQQNGGAGVNAAVDEKDGKQLAEAYRDLRRDYANLEQELEARNVRIRQLESQVAQLSSK